MSIEARPSCKRVQGNEEPLFLVLGIGIFRLPLEELDEQQLMVVYQAAMEQEPSEEEVQFAAQEGPAEGLASLV